MAVVQSFGAVQSYSPAQQTTSFTRPSVYSSRSNATYAAIYRSQPSVRTVVSFIARNMAQLGLHAYRRISDTDRERVRDHEMIQWLYHPNPATTHYRLIESLLNDLGIYFQAYWLKVRGRQAMGFVRLPPEEVTVTGYLLPDYFVWSPPEHDPVKIKPRNIVAFGGYNPCDPLLGLSPIETLRQILAEEAAGTNYRAQFLLNSARLEGVVLRPLQAPRWTTEQKQSWREQWQARFAGQPGQVAVLEDGMSFVPTSYSARESEFTDSRKLTREEVAAAYHVPLPMVGILDHATFSNIKEQHKNLYQDSLGPWTVMIQEELERQVLIECEDQDGIYPEFNIAEKLKGSFEEQAMGFQTMVGRPVMTVNEARARLNLPSIKDDPTTDQIALPLNTAGSGNEEDDPKPSEKEPLPAQASVIRDTWARQRRRLAALPAEHHAAAFDVARWDRELTADLEALYRRAGQSPDEAARAAANLAGIVNAETLELLTEGQDAFSSAREAALYGF